MHVNNVVSKEGDGVFCFILIVVILTSKCSLLWDAAHQNGLYIISSYLVVSVRSLAYDCFYRFVVGNKMFIN